ncbi:MAG: hypothetical protein JXR36_02890 [Bacteroidales bacterium]|nr:hypothetical protein [Bacteroidales bacterium]
MEKKQNVKIKNKHQSTRIYYLIIIVIGFLLYGQSITNDFNIDDDYVYENHKLVEKGIKGIPEIFTSRYNTKDEQYFGYRPLTIAIYAIEYQIFGSNPHSAHFFNILYYIICCVLLFNFLQLLLKSKQPNLYLWISFLVVMIFQSHAIHSEVVLSIKNREEIVSLIFSLIAATQSLKFFDNQKPLNLIIAIISLSLAFLAKESAIVFIVLIPISIIFFKTDIKLLPNLKLPNKINLSDKKTIYRIILIVLAFLFVVGNENFIVFKDVKINIHNFDNPINEYFFWLGYILFYTYILIGNRKTDKIITISKRNIALWSISVLLVFVSFITKSQISSLLILAMLYLTLINNKKTVVIQIKWLENINRKAVIPLLSFLILAAIVLSITYFVPKQSLPETNAPVYKWQNPSFTTTNPSNKAAIAIYSLGYYSKLLLIPHPLRFYYGYKMIPEVKMSNILVILSITFHLFLIFVALRNFNKRSLLSFGILFYFISIFPFANTFFPLTGIIAERLLFVPSIGFSIIMVFILFKLLKITEDSIFNKSLRNKTLAMALVIILPNSLITINRNSDWKDRETLYAHDIEYLENSAKANTLYANLLIGEVYAAIKSNLPVNNYKNQIELAVKHFQQAVSIDSTYSNPWHNLGYINMILYKNYELAAIQYSKSLAVDSTAAASFLNRGISNYYIGNYNQALQDFDNYLNKNQNIKDKELDKAYVFTAKSKLELGDTVGSTEYYLLAFENLKVENLNKAVLDDIKKHFIIVKRFDLAIRVSDLEISFNPEIDAPYVDKGNYYLLSGDTVKAIENWEIAFEKFNGNFNIGMTLQQYFTSKGNIEKANYYYNKAVQYRQTHP